MRLKYVWAMRAWSTFVAITTIATAALTGCSGNTPQEPQPPKATSEATATPDATPAPTGEPQAPAGDAGGRITGRVMFVGEELLPMGVPTQRATSDHCKDKPIKHNALVAGPTSDGCTSSCEGRPRPLGDVIVRLPLGAVPANTKSGKSDKPAVVTRQDCVSNPRALAMTVSHPLQIVNSDPIVHNVAIHSLTPKKTMLNSAQPKGAEPITHTFTSPGLYRIGSDIHGWMRSFVWVSDHPHATVTDTTGEFILENIPAGTYQLEAWHSFMGLKRIEVTVIPGGRPEKITIEYDGSELEPPENTGELDDLFD